MANDDNDEKVSPKSLDSRARDPQNKKSTKKSSTDNLLIDEIPVLSTVSERVDFIADLMYDLRWVTGKTGKLLAKAWNLDISTIQNYSSEASRRVTVDSESAKRDITAGALKLFAGAVKSNDAKSAAVIGKLLADVSGANAPIEQKIDIESTPDRARRLMATAFVGDVGKNVAADENSTEANVESSETIHDSEY